jgi:hypothetical protein
VVDRDALDDPADFVEPMYAQPGLFVVRSDHPLLKLDALQPADIVAWPLVFIGRVSRRLQAPIAAGREQARAAGRLHPAFPALVHESPASR